MDTAVGTVRVHSIHSLLLFICTMHQVRQLATAMIIIAHNNVLTFRFSFIELTQLILCHFDCRLVNTFRSIKIRSLRIYCYRLIIVRHMDQLRTQQFHIDGEENENINLNYMYMSAHSLAHACEQLSSKNVFICECRRCRCQ